MFFLKTKRLILSIKFNNTMMTTYNQNVLTLVDNIANDLIIKINYSKPMYFLIS